MAKLTWGSLSDRTYNYGVSKVVLYNEDGTKYAKWPGVTSIKETSSGASFEPIFFDGRKFYNYPSTGGYEAEITAVSFPKEFLGPLGVEETRPGFFLTNQAREVFHMAYQTETSYGGYKIHLVANIISGRASSENKSISDSIEPEVFTWKFTAIPPPTTGGYYVLPYSKVSIDSQKIDSYTLALIEDYLYGTELDSPRFPIENLFIDI
jgi:hypothetical protein